jgi:hypothetical protein
LHGAGGEQSVSSASVAPDLLAGTHVVLIPDPATETHPFDAGNSVIAHVDAATERLIVERPYVDGEPFVVENGVSLLVLIAQSGDGLYSRPFVIENIQTGGPNVARRAGWLVLRPTDLWQRIDRRRAERVVVSVPVARGRRFPSSGGSLTIEFVVRDLSEGGLLLETDQRVGLGDTVEFSLPLEDNREVLLLRARVQRVQQGADAETVTWLAGCKFEGLRPADQLRIAGFVARNRRLESIDTP